MLILNGLPLVIQLQNGKFVVIIFSFFALTFTSTCSFAYIALSAIFCLILGMSCTRYRSNSDILWNEIISCKVVKHISIFNTSIILLLLLLNQSFQFFYHYIFHASKDWDEVIVSWMKSLAINECSKLTKDTFGPATDLVIDNVDTFEFFLGLSVIFL